jgi:hypothetical protein
MSGQDTIRKAYRARWNKVVRSAKFLIERMDGVNPDLALGEDIDDLRSTVEDITQCFHEFNAYKNAYETMQ